jgi:transposase
MIADGHSAREVARRLGISRNTVDLWRTRYATHGCDGLAHDMPGRGRRAVRSAGSHLSPSEASSSVSSPPPE